MLIGLVLHWRLQRAGPCVLEQDVVLEQEVNLAEVEVDLDQVALD